SPKGEALPRRGQSSSSLLAWPSRVCYPFAEQCGVCCGPARDYATVLLLRGRIRLPLGHTRRPTFRTHPLRVAQQRLLDSTCMRPTLPNRTASATMSLHRSLNVMRREEVGAPWIRHNVSMALRSPPRTY